MQYSRVRAMHHKIRNLLNSKLDFSVTYFFVFFDECCLGRHGYWKHVGRNWDAAGPLPNTEYDVSTIYYCKLTTAFVRFRLRPRIGLVSTVPPKHYPLHRPHNSKQKSNKFAKSPKIHNSLAPAHMTSKRKILLPDKCHKYDQPHPETVNPPTVLEQVCPVASR